MLDFCHLHVHSQYSLLDGASDIDAMIAKAVKDDMKAIAITDHGNMFGVFKFVAAANKANIKPIAGCEFYLVEDRHKQQFGNGQKDIRYHQVLLAKNQIGYQNLSKLCTLGYQEGLYGKYPRIDKELLLRYHEGLIATTCCLAGEVPRAFHSKGEAEAEELFKWWLNLFGDDYYIELQRHGIPEQEKLNQFLKRMSLKHNVPMIVSNDAHYVDVEDNEAHDILLCINTGEKKSTPTNKDFGDNEAKVKGARFAFYNDQFYLKTKAEMQELFKDFPEAVENTVLVAEKVEPLSLEKEILLPNFPLPKPYQSMDEYLKDLTYDGAKARYGQITAEVEERINFELFTIKTMGFAGYFLIVSDFIKAGKDMGVVVGPGRGSAAGSVVAYCIGITNIDPIKYNLLFERFLNPDRKSMPDIDTDFDDEGRQKVIDYVVEKYGHHQVAHIGTFSTMAAKMSIKDVARVLDLPLNESNELAKRVPEIPGIKLKTIIEENENHIKSKWSVNGDHLKDIALLKQMYAETDLKAQVLQEAVKLEGSVRGTGIHAAGVIIAPKDLSDVIPLFKAKDTEMLISQYDGNIIESAGVLKMDFLGLKTLSIIRDALELIKTNHGIEIDLDTLALDDKKTYTLFQNAETNAVFQFESDGMQKYLKELKPDNFDDLIAMAALYRPGPMEHLPLFIDRKHGRKAIHYDLPVMEELLKETYGVTVYQEQVMLLSQKIAGFSKGEADGLRKAMGKKKKNELDKLKNRFLEGGTANGYKDTILQKIWTDWEAFASYAFNKSHSTCYALVAYYSGYLKANYPSEFMASVLTHSLSNIDKISFFMEECRSKKIKVLGPDLNESRSNFSVDKNGSIRFGLAAIKGVGEMAADAIIKERNENGNFTDVYQFMERVDLKSVNKKSIESLILAGAFDCFKEHKRSQYFAHALNEQRNGIELLMAYGNSLIEKKNSSQTSLFDMGLNVEVPKPTLPECEMWPEHQRLGLEKEVIGFYISGHPLDTYRDELKYFCNTTVSEIENRANKELRFAGIISSVNHRIAKNGNGYVNFDVEDKSGKISLALYGKDYLKFKHLLENDLFIFLRGIYKERFYGSDQMQFKIHHIELLAEIGKKMAKSIVLHLRTQKINQKSIEILNQIMEDNKGDIPLKMMLHCDENNWTVNSVSRKYRTHYDKLLFEQINNLEGVDYNIES
ncbi:MAG TPA: DNA polymerase III subunit alpha [Bacteroidia bacterium]|nr:DNA polymerase III subunit alpha [Bacteroidia bacterium]HNT81098.1 DNA polymerase III subunit alpha [Bacteroidia bacterium]